MPELLDNTPSTEPAEVVSTEAPEVAGGVDQEAPQDNPVDALIADTPESSDAGESASPEASKDAEDDADKQRQYSRRELAKLIEEETSRRLKAEDEAREARRRTEELEAQQVKAREDLQKNLGELLGPDEEYRRLEYLINDTDEFVDDDERARYRQWRKARNIGSNYLDALDKAFHQRVGDEVKSTVQKIGVIDPEAIQKAKTVSQYIEIAYQSALDNANRAWQGKYDALKAELETKRAQSGAGAPNLPSGGQGAGSNGRLTLDAWASMSPDERQKLRSTPEGRAQIDALTSVPR